MLESSPHQFSQLYRAYANAGELLPRPEGSPLLEFTCQGAVLALLDRSGPYLPAGPCHMVVHGLTACAEAHPAHTRAGGLQEADPTPPELPEHGLEVHRHSAVRGAGTIVHRTASASVVAAGPLYLVLSRPAWPGGGRSAADWGLPGQVGDTLVFETLPPLHGFYLFDDPGRE